MLFFSITVYTQLARFILLMAVSPYDPKTTRAPVPLDPSEETSPPRPSATSVCVFMTRLMVVDWGESIVFRKAVVGVY